MHEAAPPKCNRSMKVDARESFVDLRVWLEEKVLSFLYQYWNVEECCIVAVSLELLNNVEDNVFMIHNL